MRFLATILFVLMTFILPTAGVTRNFCTITMAFVSDDGKCPMETEDCCCEEGKHDTRRPDCMIAAKLLPSADKSPTPLIPDSDSLWILLPATLSDFSPAVAVEVLAILCQRAPPVFPDPLYLTQRRLLI